MANFSTLSSRVVPLPINDVDTDQIIPARFLKATDKKGMGNNLFADWRYNSDGSPKSDFVLNQPAAAGCQILLAGDNFGCGSSREHAPWAILDYGIRAILAPSYADIFYNNCFKNGILPVTLSNEQMDELFRRAEQNEGYRLTADLEQQVVTDTKGLRYSFTIDPFRRECLLKGLDDIGLTLMHEADIAAYEKKHLRVPAMHAPLDVKYHHN
jgi:3-isopropylmalate/(R)-2-methylmalate dehydratase small subunit